MWKAIVLSIFVHALLVGALVWADKLYLKLFHQKKAELQMISASLLMDKTYKPTDTAMRKGAKDKNLPPPKVEPPKKDDLPTFKEKASKNKKDSDKENKKSLKDILKKIREESKDDRPPPKINNFPTNEKGEKNATGTGGRGDRILSPAEQALQSAMRRHFEITSAEIFKKQNPDAMGFYNVRLVGVGTQFQIVSLVLLESTGFNMLDRQCELAIRRALDEESFATDVIFELNGKETKVLCTP